MNSDDTTGIGISKRDIKKLEAATRRAHFE